MELLSPAGSFKGFLGAVNAGCDAVYLGGTRFGARAYAENFTDEEIIKAIEYAHLFGVKVYLTVNTLLKESEFSDCLSYVDTFYKAGLDGCILQDMGLISVFHHHFPRMECHISTQAFVTGTDGCRLFKEMGASRVVLARELSLSEIKKIKADADIEIETFIHGAMCYSYSGDCLFSSCLGGRSGNRGRCAGPCRLEYSVISDGKESKPGFYLSMKDQCALTILPGLLDADIDSLKIEGRMKKPEYSAFTTSVYRRYIDLYRFGKDHFKVSSKDIDDLKHMYLRSDIGTGYYDRNNGRDMITVGSPAYGGNDPALMQTVEEEFLNKDRKLPITAVLTAVSGEPVCLTYTYKDLSFTVTDFVVEKALSKVTTAEDMKKQIGKLGDTPFILDDSRIYDSGDCFIPVRLLNELRRTCIEGLKAEIIKDHDRRNQRAFKPFAGFKRTPVPFKKLPLVYVSDPDQFRAAVSVSEEIYVICDAALWLNHHESLVKKAETVGKELFVAFPDIVRDRDKETLRVLLKDFDHDCVKGCFCNSPEALAFVYYSDYGKSVIAGPSLYAWNNKACEVLKELSDGLVAP
nr:U32 family peptidase [Lachnospiraceae bacterium]